MGRAWGTWARRRGPFALAVVWGAAALRLFTAPEVHPPNRLDQAARQALGEVARAAEPEWRVNSARRFPGDLWSQEDDFHAKERQWAVTAAAQRGVPAADVFRAIDEGLRDHPVTPPRKATASPSKPRAFYD